MVGGLPVHKRYDDCCPPSLINGKLNFGSPGQVMCGSGMTGGVKIKGSSKSKSC